MEPLRQLNSVSQRVTAKLEGADSSKRQVQARPNRIRIIIRLITLVIGASISVILIHTTMFWYKTRWDILRQPAGYRMRGWPAKMDLTPTLVMLSVAVAAIVVQVVALLTLVGKVRALRQSDLHSSVVFPVSLMGVSCWVGAAVYFRVQNDRGWGNWTIWSYACTHQQMTNGRMSFKDTCIELNYCFYAALAVAALELFSLTLFGNSLRKSKGGEGYSRITPEKR